MAHKGKRTGFQRRVRRLMLVMGILQLALRLGGLVLARRLDEGDSSSPRLRRVKTLGGVILSLDSQELADVEVDLVFAGMQLDLSGAQPAPGGIELTLACAFGGGDIRVPRHWRVTWDRRGIGGVAIDPALATDGRDPATAELRVHVRSLFGGVNIRPGAAAPAES